MGFVIGKNGETIKRIQAETSAKVQFNMSMLLYIFQNFDLIEAKL